MTISPKIYCALDTPDIKQALDWAKNIAPVTGALKLGMEFVNTFGPQGIEKIRDTAPDADLFIDLKFHDIPNTVAAAVRTITRNFAPACLNVHAAGGPTMMRAAKDACENGSKLLAVTILTSLNEDEVRQIGYANTLEDQVTHMAILARDCGLDGVVCSAHEIRKIRTICPTPFELMVPGIRPENSEKNDQSRTMTPKEALNAGATHLVIGRPITGAPDPAKAARDILDKMQ